MKTYRVEHVGNPKVIVTAEDWRPLSEHASLKAAVRAVNKRTAHLWMPFTWDDYYRIITPSGEIVSVPDARHLVSLGLEA